MINKINESHLIFLLLSVDLPWGLCALRAVWMGRIQSEKTFYLKSNRQSMQALNRFSIPKELSCSDRAHLPLMCRLDLHADIFRFFHGWRGGRALAAPVRNSLAPPHQNTPAQHCSRTRTDRSLLRSSQVTQLHCCWPLKDPELDFNFKRVQKEF